jgi:hypothetical protein
MRDPSDGTAPSSIRAGKIRFGIGKNNIASQPKQGNRLRSEA